MAGRHLASKRPSLEERWDVVLVGAGIHAAAFLYTLRMTASDLRVLVLEKSHTISSTFARLGDSLILNSPTSSRARLDSNLVPGHFVQASHFDEVAERPFPTAKHLHQLATIVLFHADADIRFGFGVDGIETVGDGYSVSCGDRTTRAKAVIVCNGMGDPRRPLGSDATASSGVVTGDDFIAACYEDESFLERWRDKRIAVVGDGDTANSVMEYLLPLTYPHSLYGLFWNASLVPAELFWVGQGARTVQEFYFANKQRYCYSGGVIEFFWDGETPFDLPAEAWKETKSRIRHVPHRLDAISGGAPLTLSVGGDSLVADLVVDCTGRFNALSSSLLHQAYDFVVGDIALRGGHWDQRQESFVSTPLQLPDKRLACRVTSERIFLVGCACPLDELVDDDEAKDGSLRHQERRISLTNSKWSLEHTLPRTVALAERFHDLL